MVIRDVKSTSVFPSNAIKRSVFVVLENVSQVKKKKTALVKVTRALNLLLPSVVKGKMSVSAQSSGSRKDYVSPVFIQNGISAPSLEQCV